jgi:signal transduction histidine kinase
MRSITFKLVLAFLGLAIISIVLIVLLARWNTGAEFSRFVVDRRGADMVETLASYYRENGSWEGIGMNLSPWNAHPGPGNMPPQQAFFTLADKDGKVVYPGMGRRHGEPVPQIELSEGIPIEVDGERVGTLVMSRLPPEKNPRELEFIQRTNRMLLYSALGAAGLALLIGIFLSRSLTRPIRELTQATQAVATGELGRQVSVRSQDELGELAASFNRMSADLARSTEARQQMTADIAHELRTPLSLILGHAEAVHDTVLAPTKENFEIIREEALRLEGLVEDLRTLSLADAGELSLHLQNISTAKLLKDLKASFQPLASQKDIIIRLEVPSGIPMVEMDPARMTQVLSNLLDNALQHTPEGGQITLAAGVVPDGVAISIHDSGPGVDREELERIFDRFYRSDPSRSREGGGSGLGLAIAKSIVQAHGGQIHAENLPIGGLAIRITLPV